MMAALVSAVWFARVHVIADPPPAPEFYQQDGRMILEPHRNPRKECEL